MCLLTASAEGLHASGYSENYVQVAPDGTVSLRGTMFSKNTQLSRAALFRPDEDTAAPVRSVFDEYSWYNITDPDSPQLIHAQTGDFFTVYDTLIPSCCSTPITSSPMSTSSCATTYSPAK